MNKLKLLTYALAGASAALLLCALVLLISGSRGSAAAETSSAAQESYALSETRTCGENDPALHSTYSESGDETAAQAYANGTYLYTCIKFTGSALPEEQIYNVGELESLLGFNDQLGLFLAESGGDTQNNTYTGMDFLKFLTLAGLAEDASGDTLVEIYCGSETCACSVTLDQLRQAERTPMLVFGKNGLPLVESSGSVGYSAAADNGYGPEALLLEDGQRQYLLTDVTKVLVSAPGDTADPHYNYHNRDIYLTMEDIAFTFNVYAADGTCTSYALTTRELEQLETDYPQAVAGNYFATNGNLESAQWYGGVGGFMDYYEGLRFDWLIPRVTGLDSSTQATTDFYDRDGALLATVDDFSYFWGSNGDFSAYYTLSRDLAQISGCIPVLGIAKNGYPQLPIHDHHAEGYVDYNQLNDKLAALGVTSEVGLVINITGPFTACLPNLDGTYGGYQITTGGNCKSMNIYLK